VIRDDHRVRPCLDRLSCVIATKHALDDDRQASGVLLNPADVVESQRGLELRGRVRLEARTLPGRNLLANVGHLHPLGEGERVALVAWTVAEHRKVDGENDRPVAGIDRSADQFGGPVPVGAHVELEPARSLWCGRGGLLERDRRERRGDHHGPGRRGGPGRRCLALVVGQPLVRRRRDQHRRRDLRTEDGRRRRDGADVTQDMWTQANPLPGGGVLRQGDLVVRPARVVVVGDRIDVVTCLVLELAQIHRRPSLTQLHG
jgi:hypothetical protein